MRSLLLLGLGLVVACSDDPSSPASPGGAGGSAAGAAGKAGASAGGQAGQAGVAGQGPAGGTGGSAAGKAGTSGSSGTSPSGGQAGQGGAGTSGGGGAGQGGVPAGGQAGQAGAPSAGQAGAGTGGVAGGGSAACAGPTFLDAVAEGAWVNLDVSAAGGLQAIKDAIGQARQDHPDEPVRIRLAPGFYEDNVGGELYAQRLLRTAAAPLWIVATDPAPDQTRLGNGINLVGVAYLAIEGVTIGPSVVGAWNGSSHADPPPLATQAGVHVAGTAIAGDKSAVLGSGELDLAVYGKYEPSHHVLLRRLTIQNLFDDNYESAVVDEGQNRDGIKFNQAADVWVLDTSIRQTSRHGIDNVGVHRGTFCRNTIAHTGGGLGIEAKGGSIDALYEANVFLDVRRVELGGEATDAVYYHSADGLYTYEARHTVARDNLIVDPREAAIEFAGCLDCAALHNTVFYTSDYVVPGLASGDAQGGDALRTHASVLLGADDGAGNDCVSWDASQNDYVYIENCWGVGSQAPAPVGKPLPTAGGRVVNTAFLSPQGIWRKQGAESTIPCPLNVSSAAQAATLTLDGNYWWNGAHPLPSSGCVQPSEGSASTYSTSAPSADPQLPSVLIDAATNPALRASAAQALRPSAGSPLHGAGIQAPADSSPVDFQGTPRTVWTIGALE